MRRSTPWVSVSPLTFASMVAGVFLCSTAFAQNGLWKRLRQERLMVAKSPPPKEELSEEITLPLNSLDPRTKEYLNAVKVRILEVWSYPNKAKKGLSGKVTLKISIDGDGSLSQVKIIISSGNLLLDEGVLETIRRASPFPPIPPKFNARRLNIMAGFAYNWTRDARAFWKGVDYANKGQYDDAIASYKKAIRRNPDYFLAHRNRGWAYYKKGKYDAAIASYKEAIRLKPDDMEAHQYLGVAYAGKGDRKVALVEYEWLKTRNPDMAEELLAEIPPK